MKVISFRCEVCRDQAEPGALIGFAFTPDSVPAKLKIKDPFSAESHICTGCLAAMVDLAKQAAAVNKKEA